MNYFESKIFEKNLNIIIIKINLKKFKMKSFFALAFIGLISSQVIELTRHGERASFANLNNIRSNAAGNFTMDNKKDM